MRLASVQMLRAIAAIMVVYSHARPGVVVFARTWKYNYLLHEAFGVFGVDIFFVISGFVICYSADRLYGRKQALGFLWNRFRRINLIYYVATMATLLVWLPSLLRHERLPISTAQILSSAIVIPFPGSTGLFLSQGWTLTYEWYFYLLFFLLILFGTSKKEATLGIVLASLIFMGWLYRKNSQYLLGVYTNPIMFEFLLGVGIGYVFRRWTPGKTTALLLLIPGLVLGIGLTIVVPGYGNFPTANAPKAEWLPYTHALIWGSAAALIVAGCIFLEKTQTRVPFQNH
ncbi:MAG TPA: acyltransferase, partial [Puia sp.]|nr:acyltransferase [Puia sp.]